MADLSVPFRSLRGMAERRFRRTHVWLQIADGHVWQTVATAVMHDHVRLFVWVGYTDALAVAMQVVNSCTAYVLCNELLHLR